MKLIFKYLKPYFLIVLAVIALTLVQVLTELNLPDYMSDIVANGIQYQGITENIPQAISKSDMDKVLTFIDNKENILNQYTLINKGEKVVVKNSEIEFKEDIYVLNENHENLDDVLAEPLTYVYVCEQNSISLDNVEAIKNSLNGLEDNESTVARLQIAKIYSNVGISAQEVQTNYILSVGAKMLGIAAIGVVAQLLSTYLATKTASKIAAKMRKDVFSKVESFSSSEFSKFSTSSLITRTGNDITKTQQLVQLMMRMMLMSPMMGITAVFKVARYPQVSWILIVAIGIIISTMAILIIFAVPKFEKIQKLVDSVNSITREFLDGMLVIRAFNSQEKEEEKFDKTNKEFYRVDKFVSRMMGIVTPVMTIIMNGISVIITWFAAKEINVDAMTLGDMMAFSQYAMHVVISFMMVSVTFFMIPRSLVSVRRIEEILNTENTILDPENPKEIPNENGVLAFNNVTFRYPGAEECVLENVSFEAKPGQTVAFIGSTGSGKSTIVKLIPILFDVTEGSITYCGEDIRNYAQTNLRDKIGYATQKAVLFTGSIKSNIEFGREINNDELNQAIDISQSREIVNENAEGLDAPITQGGTNVSGGQKQRISIARALAQNKNIYIFDDSFSALDYATDKKLRAELSELIKKSKSTVIIVAQRISTIMNADKIIVLDEGKVVGEGKHQELLKNCDVYKQIAYSQLTKEELA